MIVDCLLQQRDLCILGCERCRASRRLLLLDIFNLERRAAASVSVTRTRERDHARPGGAPRRAAKVNGPGLALL